jgi:hypothetical protein
MPSRDLSVPEVSSLAWSDATVHSLEWVNGNRDLRLSIVLGDGRSVALDYCWVDQLRIDLRFGQNENFPPLAWNARFEPARNGRHSTTIDFSQHGSISFEYESVMLDGV